jgi:hypothetical protein
MHASHPGADSHAPSTSQHIPPSMRLLRELLTIDACSAGAAALVEFRPEQIDNIGLLLESMESALAAAGSAFDDMILEGKQ